MKWNFYCHMSDPNPMLRRYSWEFYILYPPREYIDLQLASISGTYRFTDDYVGTKVLFLNDSFLQRKGKVLSNFYPNVETALWSLNFMFREAKIFDYNPDYTKALEVFYEHKEKGDVHFKNNRME